MHKTAAIIGAGMAGLGAARALLQTGVKVNLYEKSPGVGGRVATRRIAGCTFDHGAQIIKPAGFSLDKLMREELPRPDLLEVKTPILPFASDGSRLPIDPLRGSEAKYAYADGITTLPKMMMQSCLDLGGALRLDTHIARFKESPEGVTLFDRNGEKIGEADALVITAPAPQAAALIEASEMLDPVAQSAQISALRTVRYRPCLSVLLGYSRFEFANDAYALIAEDKNSPLLWVAFENMKSLKRAPNGETLLIAQFGGDFSNEKYDFPDETVIEEALQALRPLFQGASDSPTFSQVKRWRYSQPIGMVAFSAVNPASSRIVVAGDALRPDNGRIHQAYESGLEAAALLSE